MVAELAKLLHELEDIVGAYIGTGLDTLLLESLGGNLADAPDTTNRQLQQETVNLLRCHHVLTIGLVEVARDFGDEFIGCDACRDGDADGIGDALANFICDQGCTAATLRAVRYVEEGN